MAKVIPIRRTSTGTPRTPPAARAAPGPRRPAERQEAVAQDPEEEELQGLYIISVASRMLDMHPQTLRKYERLGLVRPSRTVGMLRLYSQEDIERIRLIRHLQDDLGLNLAGVEVAMRVLYALMDLRRTSLETEAEALRTFVGQELDRICRLLECSMEAPEPDTTQEDDDGKRRHRPA